jgi:hypothetical protein
MSKRVSLLATLLSVASNSSELEKFSGQEVWVGPLVFERRRGWPCLPHRSIILNAGVQEAQLPNSIAMSTHEYSQDSSIAERFNEMTNSHYFSNVCSDNSRI